jgi:hypothetical protein
MEDGSEEARRAGAKLYCRILRGGGTVRTRGVDCAAFVGVKIAEAEVAGAGEQRVAADGSIGARGSGSVLDLVALALCELSGGTNRVAERLQRIGKRSAGLRRGVRDQRGAHIVERSDGLKFRLARRVAALRRHHEPQESPERDRHDSQNNCPARQNRAQRLWRGWLDIQRKISATVRANFR